MVEGGSHASTAASVAAESEKEDEEAESLMDVDIEPDSDYEEVSSQYDSCYSSGTWVVLFFSSLFFFGVGLVEADERFLFFSDNTTTLFSEVTNYKYENGRR
jgi:hypothetical protein